MRVRHERPMSDLTYSVRAPLKLTLESGKVVVIDSWSLNGVTYPDNTDILPKAGVLSIPFQGVDIQFDVTFIDGDEKGELLFSGLSGRQRETLAIFYRSILSGKMASSEDMITSLDTPVDLVPMGETEEEEATGRAKQSPRTLRVIWNVVFYLMFAAVVFGLVGGQILTRLSQVSLQHARVVAPISALHTSKAAFVEEVLVTAGNPVRRGDVLVQLSNPESEAMLDDIRADAALYEKLSQEAEARLLSHRARRAADREILRQTFLQDVADRDHPDFAERRRIDDVTQSWEALHRFDAATATGIGEYFETERALNLEAEDLSTRWSRLKRDLGNAKDSISAGNIVAPTDGVILSVDVFEDQFLTRGMPAVTMEQNTARHVQAWLDESRSDAIYVGMPTQVRFNDGPATRSLDGTITDITAAVDPDISDAFGLIVSVGFDDMDVEKTRAVFRTDAPVQLRALKDWGRFVHWGRN